MIKQENEYVVSIGRRKEAVARVRLYEARDKDGDIIVNGKPADAYFPNASSKPFYLRPFELTGTVGMFTTTVKVVGGGLSGQLAATVHGIARALQKYDPKHRQVLKKAGLLTRDSRMKERRKAGFAQKARAKKQSPKR